MARVYADQAAYEAYTGGAAPANIALLLRLGSRVVDVLLKGIVYDVDDAGLPVDADDVEALRDATCCIAAEAAGLGLLDVGGTQEWASVGIGNVSLAGRKTTEGTTSVLGVPVPPAARLFLADVGVLVVVTRC